LNTTRTATISSNNGYPVPGGSSTANPTISGNQTPDLGYPAPQGTPSPNTTSSTASTLQTTQTKQSSITPTPENKPETAKNKTAGYIILGGMSLVSIALIAAFILWKKGILKLPF
jgi:hypothetical protein